MKIYLYLPNKIMLFKIPTKVSGSFSFDENIEEEAKLINIEAHDGKWYIHSTRDVSLYVNNNVTPSELLLPNHFYILQRKNKNYLIYVTAPFDSTFLPYLYKQDLSLIIGNESSCNLKLSSQFINGIVAKIYIKDNIITLERGNTIVYVNDLAVKSNSCIINVGDKVNIYGLKLIFFNGFVLLNNPNSSVSLNTKTSNLTPYRFNTGGDLTDIDVQDVDLYHKEDYFSKSPRLRRLIEMKVINLSPPPRQDSDRRMPLILTIGPMLTMGAVSVIMLVNNISKISIGQISMQDSWPQLISSGAMLLSMLVWPSLTSLFNKYIQR